MKNRNNDREKRERRERFRRNLDQVNAYRFGEGAAVPPFRPFPHPDFMPDPVAQVVKSLKIQLPKPDGAGDSVTIPRSEYNEFVEAKAVLGLLVAAAGRKALTAYDFQSVLRMMSGVGKEPDASADA